MIVRAFIAAFALASTLHAQSTPAPQPVARFLENPATFDGEQVVLEGFLSLEDYAKALFISVDDYVASRFEGSVPVVVGNYFLDRRELYERRNVRITGVYEHSCAMAGSFCSAHPGQGRIIVSAIDILPEQPASPGWRRRDVLGSPHALVAEPPDSALLVAANELFTDISRRNRVRLRNAASGEGGSALVDDLYDPQSRATWLLFSGEGAYSSWIQDHPAAELIGFTLANDTIEPRLGAACLCEGPDCAPARDLQADRITNRNLLDPYICLTFVEGDAGWEVDPGMLLSMRHMGDYGNDLGVVLDDDREPDEELVWRWVTTPGLAFAHFMTRLRNQPRARVWYAVKAGSIDIGIFVGRPDGQTWEMDPNEGDPELSLIEASPETAARRDGPDRDNDE